MTNYLPVKSICRMSVLIILIATGCKPKASEVKTIGTIERLDPELDHLITKDAVVEIISEGYDWSEGPVWVPQHTMLLWSDVPKNTIYKWTEEKGTEVYLTPSGYTGATPSLSKEPGSNGLTLSKDNKLVLCQHGDRKIATMDAPLDQPTASFTTVADKYDGKRFNSPNDLAYRSNGDLFFTDPPYGLPNNVDDSTKEIPFQGVYKVKPSGEVILLTDSLTRPNGIALTPDEKTLIVANSDPAKKIWYAFDLTPGDSLTNARIFYDATNSPETEKGGPDGFKIDRAGNVFASGPGGIWIFNKDGKVLGKIKLPDAAANTALSEDDKTLFITNDMYVLRVKMR
ncbi:MAG TPA: SMP-30/gluconolactonase/LRE family protein [Cyclobacteriaceae bacterium]|nr:SMP-30/gluconolactonase/LRE family protein [Cyclobacteriaceae bacterium]